MPPSRGWKPPGWRSQRSTSSLPTTAPPRPPPPPPAQPAPAPLRDPRVSRALAAGCRSIADLKWRGGIVAGDDVDDETAQKLTRALNRAVAWLRTNEDRSRQELL